MKHTVILTKEDDQYLRDLVAKTQEVIADLRDKKWERPQDEFKGRKKLRIAEKQLTHSRILLQAAQTAGDPSVTEGTIAQDLGVKPERVELVCKRYVDKGLESALNPGQTKAEELHFNAWYQEHGKAVVLEVRRWLRESTKHQTGKTTTDVAQSVWASFANHHLDQTIDSTDPQCAWRVVIRAAKRHCETLNRRGTRGKKVVSIDGLTHHPSDSDSATRFDPKDTREVEPVAVLVRNECAALFTALGENEREGVAQAIQSVEGGIELVAQLTPMERQVLGLKLAKKNRDQIAREARPPMDQTQVDDYWQSIREIAEGLDDDEDDEE